MNQRWIALVIGFALLSWWGFLTYETFTTSNPIVVSRPQVLRSEAVVEGQLDAEKGSLMVERVWLGPKELVGREILLLGIPEDRLASPENRYFVPLREFGARWAVVPTPAHPKAPQQISVYPSTRSVARQFEHLLREVEKT